MFCLINDEGCRYLVFKLSHQPQVGEELQLKFPVATPFNRLYNGLYRVSSVQKPEPWYTYMGEWEIMIALVEQQQPTEEFVQVYTVK